MAHWLTFLSAAGVLLWGGCSRPASLSDAAVPPAIRVRVAVVRHESLPVTVETSGTVRSVQRATLAAKVGGTISSLPLALGQTVRAGDVLATISAAELSARVAQAAADLAQIERELARERRLVSAGAAPSETVKALEDRLAAVRAALVEAETMAGYATLRAPFAGIVVRKLVEPGDYAVPGAPVVQLDGTDRFEIEVALPESRVSAVAVGSPLKVEVAGEGFEARVAELSGAADPASRTLTAKLTVPPGALVRPGRFVRVLVPGAPAPALLVPRRAISLFGQMERVFVIGDGDRASLRLVRTGAAYGDSVEIVSGLAVAERVVVDPPATLRDGQPLNLLP